jgi:prepilin-type N-terminal cleavage/methylation domain-containing protein
MNRQRRAFTLLEFVVALLLFGIAMSGLFPLVVMYSRALESLEQRPSQMSFHRNASVDGNAYRVGHPLEWYQVPANPALPNSGEWVHRWYLVPFSDSAATTSNAWARKLGASASIKYKSPTSTLEEPLA